jgi:hypothetical protein
MYSNTGSELGEELLRNSSPLKIRIYSIKSDYSRSLSKNAKLEIGVKSSLVQTDVVGNYSIYDNSQAKWIPDAGRSNHFAFHENINAAYLNYNRQLNKKFAIQVGLRAEQTNNNGHEFSKNDRFNNHYTQLFPTFFGSYTPNQHHTLTLTYGRRTDRPAYMILNPFQYVIDQFSYREGNPHLHPILTNNVELAWNYKSMLNMTINYAKQANMFTLILRNVKVGNDYINYQTPANIASRRTVSLSVNFHKNLTKWWMTNSTVSFVNNRLLDYADGKPVSVNITACFVNISNQFPLKKGWTFDLSGWYRGKRLEGFPVYVIGAGTFSLGASKKINSKATITCNINDPLWVLRGGIDCETATFIYHTHNKMENRYVTLTFSYRFGKTLQQQNRKSGSPDEQNRL